jgi:cation transport regulator ChaC
VSALYFAYGSNMAASEMEAWCPAGRCLGPAELVDHRLELRRRSLRWRGGAADLVRAPGESVWGVLYELPPGALEELDRKEGAAIGAYRRREVTVMIGGERCAAVTYEVADKEPEQLAPTPAYAELLLRAAAERRLPDEYLRALEDRLTRIRI